MELDKMTLPELKALKIKWYDNATQDGRIKKLADMARYMGLRQNHNYGPKYLFNNDFRKIEIYVDDYGNYMTVKVDGKLKVSTHNERLYVPGEWEEVIEACWPEVLKRKEGKLSEEEKKEKIKLIGELS